MNINSIPILLAETENKIPRRKQREFMVAVDLRATVGTNPRSEIAGYQLHAASGGEFTLRD